MQIDKALYSFPNPYTTSDLYPSILSELFRSLPKLFSEVLETAYAPNPKDKAETKAASTVTTTPLNLTAHCLVSLPTKSKPSRPLDELQGIALIRELCRLVNQELNDAYYKDDQTQFYMFNDYLYFNYRYYKGTDVEDLVFIHLTRLHSQLMAAANLPKNRCTYCPKCGNRLEIKPGNLIQCQAGHDMSSIENQITSIRSQGFSTAQGIADAYQMTIPWLEQLVSSRIIPSKKSDEGLMIHAWYVFLLSNQWVSQMLPSDALSLKDIAKDEATPSIDTLRKMASNGDLSPVARSGNRWLYSLSEVKGIAQNVKEK